MKRNVTDSRIYIGMGFLARKSEAPLKQASQSAVCCLGVVSSLERVRPHSACRPEWLSVRHRMNHFALRTQISLKAVRYAFDELQLLKAA